MFRSSFAAGAAGAALFLSAQISRGAVFAQYVETGSSYAQGTFDSSYELQFNNPQVVNVALNGAGAQTIAGNPAGMTGLPGYTQFPFPGIISPFNPAYDTDQLVSVGIGGRITLHFPQPVPVSAAPSVGVFTAAGLFDAIGNGDADAAGDTFSSYQAVVNVSQDGSLWKSLGRLTFDIPENFYTNASTAYDTAPPANPTIADFGKPFTETTAAFSNQSYQQIVGTLSGSAGGTWLDLSASGLSQVNYIQFTEPSGQVPDGSYLALEAVSVADNLPEPTSAAGLLMLAALLPRRRRPTWNL